VEELFFSPPPRPSPLKMHSNIEGKRLNVQALGDSSRDRNEPAVEEEVE